MTDRTDQTGSPLTGAGNEEEIEEEIEREVEATRPEPLAGALLQRHFNRLPDWGRVIGGGALATLAGLLFHLGHTPLPWLLGALFCAALMSMTGFSLPVPAFVRQYGQSVAGFAVGVFFTPEVGRQVLDLGLIITLAGVVSILVSVLLSLPLARLGGCDRRSAFFAVMPGGLAEMAGLAHQFNANITVVSVAQSLRVVVIVLTVPAGLTLYMHHAATVPLSHRPEMSTLMLAAGVVTAGVCAQVMNRLRIFNAFLLGGLIVGAGFGLMAQEPIAAPPYARAIAQIAIGISLGARFHWLTLRRFGSRFVPATVVATLLLLLANVAIAWAVSGYVDFPTAVLAASPGGVAEMSLTAEALGLAPPIVAAWHFVRIVLVATLTAPLFRFWERKL
ncbi:AbrB family transcriptional regulator [Ancylobacter sp. A5.8]|uniref:AbrB family transcriptional regulator n=1 Tax=Ancylobacter gelatini TaxID=2919920 RepID=UPI001F4D7F18|nr:AbrB family transcriptional regulator [Ancylobacter gelatini]MCJ8142575.1 AbrB family transcriptional regulator [Ancylobacter gelatini]